MRLLTSLAVSLALIGFGHAFQSPSPLAATRVNAGRVKGQERRSISPSTSTSSTRLHSAVPITTVLTALDTFWQTSPYAAAALICGFKASLADIVAQKRDYRKRAEKERKAAEKENEAQEDAASVVYNPNLSEVEKKADWKRNLAFLIYGALYQGVTQEHVYNHIYPVWFGSGTSLVVVLSKVFFDLLIQTTLVTLPIAYLTKSIIYRYSFKEAMRRYIDDIKNHGLLKKYYMLWGPVQCMTFSIVPEHLRVTFIACVSFFWLIILSTIASKKPATPTATVAEKTLADECSLEDGLTCNIDG